MDLESKLAALVAQTRAIRTTLDRLGERLDGSESEARFVPDGNEAVLQVLRSTASAGLTLQGVVRALGERGWLPPGDRAPDAVRVTLARLVRNGLVVRAKHTYRLVAATGDGLEGGPERPVEPAS